MTPKWPRSIREVRSGLPEPAADPQREPDPAATEPESEAGTERITESEPVTDVAPPSDASGEDIQELAAMAEALLAQAAELRRQTQELAAELAGEEDPAGAPDREPVSGMRIVAVNMAAGGRSREEAEHYLREQFGESPDPALLDEVFGDPADEPGRD